MGKSTTRRVSPALVVSIVALVLAAGGTSFASAPIAFVAKTLGLNKAQKSQVKAIADKEIAIKAPGLSVLSSVTATNAVHATTATTATTAGTAASATNATNATNATKAASAENSNQLGGVAASSYERRTAQSGEILTGQLAGKYPANAVFIVVGASFPVPLPAGTPEPNVEFLQGSTNSACPGLGKVTIANTICVYGYNDSNISSAGLSGSTPESVLYGFSVDVFPTTASSAGYLLASWAYKVP